MNENRNLPETILDRETGRVLRRDVRPFVVSHGGQSITVDLLGYYPDGQGDGIVIGEDMRAAGEALKKLKATRKDPG